MRDAVYLAGVGAAGQGRAALVGVARGEAFACAGPLLLPDLPELAGPGGEADGAPRYQAVR